MTSLSKVLAAIVVIGAISLGAKFVYASPARIASGIEESAAVQKMLSAGASSTPQLLHYRPADFTWSAWRFEVRACNAIAAALPDDGDGDVVVKLLAHRNDRVLYIYKDYVGTTRPILHLVADLIAYRVLSPFLRSVHPPYFVMLIEPGACDAPQSLPWRTLWPA